MTYAEVVDFMEEHVLCRDGGCRCGWAPNGQRHGTYPHHVAGLMCRRGPRGRDVDAFRKAVRGG